MGRPGRVDGHLDIDERRLARVNRVNPGTQEKGILIGARIVVTARETTVMVCQRRLLLPGWCELVELAVNVKRTVRAVEFEASPSPAVVLIALERGHELRGISQ